MEIKRYSLIVRRWVWFLVLAVACAALFAWFVLTRTGLTQTPNETASLVLLVTVAGLVWGLIGVFGIEALMDNVKAVEDIRKITPAPILSTVELDGRSGGVSPFIVFGDPEARSAEAFRYASRRLLPAERGKGRTLLVCAPQSSHHVARVGANLAAAAALAGHYTLLIDANRTEGELSSALHLEDHLGFGEAISDPRGEIMLHLLPSIPNLQVLPVGTLSMDEPLTFTDGHLRSVIDRSGAHGSAVIIVGPPAGAQPHTLGMLLARSTDEVVLLAVAEETKRKALYNTIRSLQEVNANLAGIIFVRPSGSRLLMALESIAGRRSEKPRAHGTAAHGLEGTKEAPRPTFTPLLPREAVQSDSWATRAKPPAAQEEVYTAEAPVSTPQASGEVEMARPDNLDGTPVPRETALVPQAPAPAATGEPGSTPHYDYDAPIWRRLMDVGAKWAAVLSLWIRARLTGSRAVRTGNPRRVSVMREAGTRAQLAGAYVVRSIAVRRSRATRRKIEEKTPPHKRIEASVPGLEIMGGNEEKVVQALLKAAERARRRGAYRDAKDLVDRVLDRDPHNEDAWQMRLQIGELAPMPSAPRRPYTFTPLPEEQPSRRGPAALIVALLAVALLGAGGYVYWPGISRALGDLGQRFAPALPTLVPGALATAPAAPTAVPSPAASSRMFETGHEVAGAFLDFWDDNGGAPIFGSPISPRISEGGWEVQYFERARFELERGEDGAENVLLGRLGAEVPVTGTVANPLPEGLRGEATALGEGGILTPRTFFTFWEGKGGVPIFGFPLSPVLVVTEPDGRRLAVQYFERARFEYHPEGASEGNEVQLSPLGIEVYRLKHGN
jgi:Mrp family chromosome partitioning ATPase